MRLHGSAAIVTGGASGLGAATARALAAAGANDAILDLDVDAAKTQAARFGGLGTGCDVTDGDSAVAAMARVRAEYGLARVLVCCAGIAPAGRELAAQGIRVNAIAPGVFETPMVAAMPEEAKTSLCAGVPFPSRFGRAEAFAALALHIVESRTLNGTGLRLDGSNRMAPRKRGSWTWRG